MTGPTKPHGATGTQHVLQGTDLQLHFKQLERRVLFGLLLTFLLPLLSLSAYFHIQFQTTLKETSKLNLAVIAESQRNTVDLFLQERLVNIFSLFHSSSFSLSPNKLQMERLLQQLRRASDAFIDVGFLNHEGIQIGYAGPYSYLQDKDYSDQLWFIGLESKHQNYQISDIYHGFRNKLHFTIATKQIIDGKPFFLRATLDPDKFYLFLATINYEKGGESSIINQNGRFQLANPRFHKPLSLSTYHPPRENPSGVHIIERNGEMVIAAHAWLSEANWALLVNQPLRQAFAQLYRTRRIILYGSILLLVVVVMAVWFATRALIGKARENAEMRGDLYNQLLHASKLASLGELATGVAHEINNPLAIILATSGVIRDGLNPEFDANFTDDQVVSELNTIDNAVLRARDITQQLLDFARKNRPQLTLTNINTIVEDVFKGLKERTLALENVIIKRNLQPNLPHIMVDSHQIRQVFFNLINNAGDAIDGEGTITISTESVNQEVRVSIEDTGIGMTSEQVKKIFDPFFSTKEVGQGTGLGLSVSLSIVESMGGTIEVQSMPGAGSLFIVILPLRSAKGAINEQREQQTENITNR